MALTPDKLTQRYYSERGYTITKTESFNAYTQRRADLLGFIDYLVISPEETIGVQTTSWSNHNARVNKILEKRSFVKWVSNKNRTVIVQSWKKQKGRWVSREQELTLDDYERHQADVLAKQNEVDTNSELYQMLFPSGGESGDDEGNVDNQKDCGHAF